MIPTRIAVKNFLTFGEAIGGGPVEFVFPDGEPLWVLCGANGSGKSAVFDAITYALYGQHRGSKQQAREKDKQLIRHGANGFEIEVDFAFGGTEYRIRHTRPRKGRTTQHLQKKAGDGWVGVLGGDAVGATTAADIERWVTGTLGLGYEAFTNSVLLKQGEADKLFTAGRDDRLAVLKGIIGFEKFEALSGDIGKAVTEQADEVKKLLARRDAIREVSDDDIAAADATRVAAEDSCATARAALNAANDRVANARQWETLERERKELTGKIAAAEERQKFGRDIRNDKKTLDDLVTAVPVLESLFALRARLAAIKIGLQTAADTVAERTSARDAARAAATAACERAAEHKARAVEYATATKELAAEIKRGHSFLTEADAVSKLDQQLSEYPADLDALFNAAVVAVAEGSAAAQRARDARTRAEVRLRGAEDDLAQFADVTVGVPCPHCRRPVDEGHAAEVRAGLARQVERYRRESAAAAVAAEDADARHAVARAGHDDLQQKKASRDKLAARRDTKLESLRAFGMTGDANALRAELAEKDERRRAADQNARAEEAAEQTETATAARLDRECDGHDRAAKAAEKERAKHDADQANIRGQEQTTRAQLSGEWAARLTNLDAATVGELAAARDRLAASGVAERFRELEQDETRRAEWEERVAVLVSKVGGISDADRVSEADARAQQARADARAKEAGATAEAEAAAHRKLVEDKAERDARTAEHRDADERHRLLVKLDKLLGEAGLQRELVRDAEETIVAYANETLHHLSDGDLALEEDLAPESTKTFDLRVRRGGGEPIGVAFLSGSQRFRVAVSVALAVGRFASGRARPLEAVIIDEGFGSLDPLGLRAMAAELKRLQQAGALQRVILVSHQPDFTDQFSVGYTLEAGEYGTTAAAFRR